MVRTRDRQCGVSWPNYSEPGDVGNVGALVEEWGFPPVVDVSIDRLAVNNDVGVCPVGATASPVHEGLYNFGAIGDRYRCGSTTQLRERVNVGTVGVHPDVGVNYAEVADLSASFDQFTLAVYCSCDSSCANENKTECN